VQTLVQNESLCLPAVLRGIVEAVSDAESLGAKEAQVLQVSTKLAAREGSLALLGEKGSRWPIKGHTEQSAERLREGCDGVVCCTG
jgi:hypothetical protein